MVSVLLKYIYMLIYYCKPLPELPEEKGFGGLFLFFDDTVFCFSMEEFS